MGKKCSHNHGQPRNLQHTTQKIKEKFNTKHIYKYTNREYGKKKLESKGWKGAGWLLNQKPK